MNIQRDIQLQVFTNNNQEIVVRTNINPSRNTIILREAYGYKNLKLKEIIKDLDNQTLYNEEECDFEFIESVVHNDISDSKKRSMYKTSVLKYTKKAIKTSDNEEVYQVINSYIKIRQLGIAEAMSKTQKCTVVINNFQDYKQYITALLELSVNL